MVLAKAPSCIVSKASPEKGYHIIFILLVYLMWRKLCMHEYVYTNIHYMCVFIETIPLGVGLGKNTAISTVHALVWLVLSQILNAIVTWFCI